MGSTYTEVSKTKELELRLPANSMRPSHGDVLLGKGAVGLNLLRDKLPDHPTRRT